jgi:hypothetical protein
MLAVEPLGCVAERRRRTVARRGQRDRRDAAGDERALLVEGEREAEVGELPEGGRSPRPGAGLLGDPGGGSLDERRRGRASLVASELDAWRIMPAIESRLTTPTIFPWWCSANRAGTEPAEGAAVRGEEEQRVGGDDCATPREAPVRPRELDQRRGP